MGFLTRLLIPRGRSIATSLRSGSKKKKKKKGISRVYRHGNCPVNHRTPEAAARCRNA